MSFYTSLTGLNASSAQLGITANNVSNVGTVGFKKSRAEFGDIFATSPLENASSAIGQGVLLKKVNQQFSQGNIEFSSNSLDMAISGQGFFALKPKLTSNNYAYTRAGSFSVNNDRYVVDSSGQYLQTFPVNDDGSVIATGLESASSLQLPSTSGLPVASSKIILGLNLPAGADILAKTKFTEDNPYRFDRTNSDTFNKSTSITLYDSLGNPHIATVYYIKTTSATEEESTNKWDTRIFIGDHELEPKLITSKNDKSETMYMNEFGIMDADPSLDDPTFNPNGAHPLYFKDEQNIKINSERAALSGGFMATDLGHDFGSTDELRVTFRNGSTSKDVHNGTNFFSISVDGSDPKSISVGSGSYTGTLLAAEMTKQANAAFGDEKYMKLPEGAADRAITIAMQTKNGTYYNTNNEEGGTTVTIDRYFDGTTTPPTNFTLEQLIRQVKDRVAVAGLPVDVTYNTRTRAFKFTATDSDFIKIKASSGTSNQFGLSATPSFAIDSLPFEGGQIAPKGDTILDTKNQRAGILIEYDKDARKFTFSSGSSGSPSKVAVGVPTSSFEIKNVYTTQSTYASTKITLSAATIVADDTASIKIDGKTFTTAALGAAATAIQVATAFAKLTSSDAGWDIQQGTDTVTGDANAELTFTKTAQYPRTTYASTVVTLADPTVATAAAGTDTATLVIEGTTFTTAALVANATKSDIGAAFAALAITDSGAVGWDISNNAGVVTFTKNSSYTNASAAITAQTGVTTTLSSLAATITGTGSWTASTPTPAAHTITVGGDLSAALVNTESVKLDDGHIAFTYVWEGNHPNNASGQAAAAVELKAAIESNADFNATYTVGISGAVLTLTEKTAGVSTRAFTNPLVEPLAGAGTFATAKTVTGLDSTAPSVSDRPAGLLDAQIGFGTDMGAIPLLTLTSGSYSTRSAVTVAATNAAATGASAVYQTAGTREADTTAADIDTDTFVPAQAGVTTMTFQKVDALSLTTMKTMKAIFPGGATHSYEQAFLTNQETTLRALAAQIQAGEDTIETAIVTTTYTTALVPEANGMILTFTGLADGTTLATGSYNISQGSLTAAEVPRPEIATIAKADNPPRAVPVIDTEKTSVQLNQQRLGGTLPAKSAINFSGLELVDGDRIGLAIGGSFATAGIILRATFDTNLATTVKNLAADMALQGVLFSDVSVENSIITFTGPKSGDPMTKVQIKIDHELLDESKSAEIGMTKVGSKWMSNSEADLDYDSINDILGIGESYDKEVTLQAGTGLTSTPGSAKGSKAGVDISGTFGVTAENNVNVINVTIDGIDGQVVVPPGSYTGTTFAAALEERINLIAAVDGEQVGGVTVAFDLDGQSFKITSGTVGPESFVNVNGSSNWGLANTVQIRGNTPTITVIKQATDAEGNKLFIDLDGNETTVPPKVMPTWSPIYLDKGELTYDTFGKLVSPKEGVIYSPYDPNNGSNLLNLSVDYGKNSTQYSAPFSVLSLSQDGYPSGRLDGLGIDSSGVVRANYTNGNQVALGKLILANFANPNGLKQVGNANYVATTNSGAPVLGEAGGDGYGTIQGGALERANVDLTEELVNLITAQRNFQANAKAIETSSTLTQTIINIRG